MTMLLRLANMVWFLIVLILILLVSNSVINLVRYLSLFFSILLGCYASEDRSV